MPDAVRSLRLAVTVAATLAAAVPALADGPVLLTVTGEITAPTRGPVDPEQDKLFIFNEVSFDKAIPRRQRAGRGEEILRPGRDGREPGR
jgi:hypothetical protein